MLTNRLWVGTDVRTYKWQMRQFTGSGRLHSRSQHCGWHRDINLTCTNAFKTTNAVQTEAGLVWNLPLGWIVSSILFLHSYDFFHLGAARSTGIKFFYSACIASIIRIQYVARSQQSIDFTCKFSNLPYLKSLYRVLQIFFCWNTETKDIEVESLIWSVIEPCTGIVCACLSTLRPLFRAVFGSGFLSRRSGASSRKLFPLHGLSQSQKTESSGGIAKSSSKWPYHEQQALSTNGTFVKVEV